VGRVGQPKKKNQDTGSADKSSPQHESPPQRPNDNPFVTETESQKTPEANVLLALQRDSS
jgi:hypothetical protein